MKNNIKALMGPRCSGKRFMPAALVALAAVAFGFFTVQAGVGNLITLTPLVATNLVNTSHTLCAQITVGGNTNNPLPGVTTTFDVFSGPNAGAPAPA